MTKKKPLSIIIGILILSCSYSVRASPIENDASKQITCLENQMELTDNEIQNTMIDISKNNANINKINSDISSINKEIVNKKNTLEKDKIDNRNTIKVIYENGGDNRILLDTFFESKNFADLISKATAVNDVLSADKKVIERVGNDKEYIDKKYDRLIKEKNKIEKLLKDNTDKLNKLNTDKAKQNEALDKLNVLKSNSNILKVANIYQQSVSLGHLIYGEDNVVSYAKNFLGIPYLWGGTSPNGFDCSGFVQYVYAHFGVNLPRTTYEQVNVGTTVTGDLEPGDLIFFGDKSKPHHVGMYIGNGEYIQAPHTGDFIKISSIQGCGYSIAKRIF